MLSSSPPTRVGKLVSLCCSSLLSKEQLENTENACLDNIIDFVFSVLSTKSVLKHIIEERLKVEVAWLGDHLDSVIAQFSSSSTPFLLLHYTPSSLILKHQLKSVMFPACKDPLLRRDGTDAHCVYAPNRLAKVVWSPVQNEAPSLYRSHAEPPECLLYYASLLTGSSNISGFPTLSTSNC